MMHGVLRGWNSATSGMAKFRHAIWADNERVHADAQKYPTTQAKRSLAFCGTGAEVVGLFIHIVDEWAGLTGDSSLI